MTEPNHEHLAAAIEQYPWAILESKWQTIQALVELRLRGERLSADEVHAALGGSPAARRELTMVGSVAVIPLFGVLSQRMNAMTEISGGTSTAIFTRDVRAALGDAGVKAIVIDVDSPGGSLYGLEEAAQLVRAGRQQKPIVAVANSLMASAAYWIGAAAGQVIAAPVADVGSIGVFMVHRDVSQAAAQGGLKFTVIKAGKYKVLGNPYEPLTTDVRARLQARVDEGLAQFVRAVAAGRRVSEDTVRCDFGEGDLLSDRRALAAGLVDRIATLDQVVSWLSTPDGRQEAMAKAGDGELRRQLIALADEDLRRQVQQLTDTPEERRRRLEDARLAAQLRSL